MNHKIDIHICDRCRKSFYTPDGNLPKCCCWCGQSDELVHVNETVVEESNNDWKMESYLTPLG